MKGTNLKPGDKMNIAHGGETKTLTVLAKMPLGDADLVEFVMEGEPGRRVRIWLQETPEGELVQKEGTIIIGL